VWSVPWQGRGRKGQFKLAAADAHRRKFPDLDYLSQEDFGLYQNMKKWHVDVGKMLAYHPHGFECHCEGRFRHIAPDALWTLLMLIQRSAQETILKAGFQGVAKTLAKRFKIPFIFE
jgi:hypothetical protein